MQTTLIRCKYAMVPVYIHIIKTAFEEIQLHSLFQKNTSTYFASSYEAYPHTGYTRTPPFNPTILILNMCSCARKHYKKPHLTVISQKKRNILSFLRIFTKVIQLLADDNISKKVIAD